MKPLHTLLKRHQELFLEEPGQIQPHTATIQPEATPHFFKPCPVPFAIKDAIGQELDNLMRQGIITPVAHSDWVALNVFIPKSDGKFCICSDYK